MSCGSEHAEISASWPLGVVDTADLTLELRQLHGIPMGKVALSPGEKATPETLAQARRVDLRVLTPWSSWEERTAVDRSPIESPSASTAASSSSKAPSALPKEVQRSDAPAANASGSSARARLPTFLRTLTPRDLGGE